MNLSNIMLLDEAAAPQQGGMPSYVIWIILGVAFVLMIAMTIIPRRKQQKQTENMMNSLKVGDKVMTIGRIVGEIIAIDNSNNTVTIKSGVGDTASTLIIDKLAIGMVINPTAPAQKKEEKKEDKKEEAPVIEKTAKESKVADVIKKQKKDAFDIDTNETKAEEKTAEPVVEEAAKEEAVAEEKVEAKVEEKVEEAVVEEVKATEEK